MADTAELPALRNFVAYATKFRRARAEREHANFSTALRASHDFRKSEIMPQGRNQIVLLLVLVLDSPISDYENDNEDDDADERFARPATIWTR